MNSNRSVPALAFLVAALAAGYWFAFAPFTEKPVELIGVPDQSLSESLGTEGVPLENPEQDSLPGARQEAAGPGELVGVAESHADQAAAGLENARVSAAGRVLSVGGLPVEGLLVYSDIDGPSRAVETGPGGAFVIPLVGLPARLMLADPSWVLVRDGVVRSDHEGQQLVLVAAETRSLAGVVVDADDDPVSGAKVRLEVPAAALAHMTEDFGASDGFGALVTSDEQGRFLLPSVPMGLSLVEFSATKYGFEEVRERVSSIAADFPRELELRMVSPLGTFMTVAGRVRDSRGDPVEGAVVACGGTSDESAADGRFELEVSGSATELSLLASAAAHQPFVDPLFGEELLRAQEAGWSRLDGVEIALEIGSFEIHGKVIQADGTPWVGWSVSLVDGTVADSSEYPPVIAERQMGQRSFSVQTDEWGEFFMEGLGDRTYRIEARDPLTQLRIRSEPIPANTQDVILQTKPNALIARVDGRVVDRAGDPVAGVELAVGVRMGLDPQTSGVSMYGVAARTNEEGRFTLERVPREGIHIRLRGDRIDTSWFEQEPLEDGQELELIASRRVYFQYEFVGSGVVPDMLRVFDGDGDLLDLTLVGSSGSVIALHAELHEGRAPALAVSDRATEIVLYKNNEEVARRPVSLDIALETIQQVQ